MTSYSAAGPVERSVGARAAERKPALSGIVIAVLLAGVLIVLALNLALNWTAKSRPVAMATLYQAILLTNGAVYFGKLEGYGTADPVLTDAFYVVSRADPNTKQISNVLVKRGKELHGPDRMYINPSQIVFVETVGPTSKVAQLIAQAANQ